MYGVRETPTTLAVLHLSVLLVWQERLLILTIQAVVRIFVIISS